MPKQEFKAPTRHGDPQTSFEAALTIQGEKMTTAMLQVLYVLSSYLDRPLCDEELCVHYDAISRVPQTHQSVRSRRAQLTRLGYVEQVGFTVNNNGNRCRTWRLTRKGRNRIDEEYTV